MKSICEDLKIEYNDLDAVVAGLDEEAWDLTTPFYGWTIKDEISHLAYYDAAALQSLTDREVFITGFEALLGSMKPGDDFNEEINTRGRQKPIQDLLTSWCTAREHLVAELEKRDARDRLAWYGPDMSARSFTTARLMEIWAHGQDILGALGLRRQPTARLRHIAHMGVATYGWSFVNRQMEVPKGDVRVELSGPSNALWTWGPEDALNAVKGDAEAFCLVVTQRRNVADTNLVIRGSAAHRWMTIAQAFAGPPADPPEPGNRTI